VLVDSIKYALRGHAPAIDAFLLVRDVLHFWDDLIDGDKTLDASAVNAAMFNALVTLPSNPFWRQHQDSLLPILVNAVANWHTANEFEAGDDNRRLSLAFVIRSDYANLLIHMTYLVGGYDWMMGVAPRIRDLWTGEDFTQYLGNLDIEREARKQKELKHVL
jgi:hypothetical protein